jgi:hypothetical protein
MKKPRSKKKHTVSTESLTEQPSITVAPQAEPSPEPRADAPEAPRLSPARVVAMGAVVLVTMGMLWLVRNGPPFLPTAESGLMAGLPVNGAKGFAFDSDGVYRVLFPSQTERAAYLTVFRLWNIPTPASPADFETLDHRKALGEAGLMTYEMAPDIHRLRLLDLPFILQGRWSKTAEPTHAVLAGMTDSEAIVLDPLEGAIRIPLNRLPALWSGIAVVVWRPLAGITLPLPTDAADPSVKSVQEALNRYGLYPGAPNGLLDTNTRRAIRFFQLKHGLDDTGELDAESFVILSHSMSENSPRLTRTVQ